MSAEKYQYIEGDMFDPEGLVLRVTYDDGTTQNITEGFTFDERPLTLEDFIMVFSSFYFAPSQQAPSRPIPRRPCEVYARGCICQRSCLLQLLKRLQPMMRLMVS